MRRLNQTLLSSAVLAAGLVLLAGHHPAHAQFSSQSARSIRNATRNYLYNRPTVSPYLNLTTRDANVGMPNYFTMVRPQIEQRENEVMRQRQSAQMQAQIDQVQAQVRESQQQAAGMMLTGRVGWSARGYPRFGTHLNYYPGFQRLR
jgi:hypothetical protein